MFKTNDYVKHINCLAGNGEPCNLSGVIGIVLNGYDFSDDQYRVKFPDPIDPEYYEELDCDAITLEISSEEEFIIQQTTYRLE